MIAAFFARGLWPSPNGPTWTTLGDNVGSVQGWATGMPHTALTIGSAGNHTHSAGLSNNNGPWGQSSQTLDWMLAGVNTVTNQSSLTSPEGSHTHSLTGGDKESRPVNVNVNYIIKY